MSDPPRLESFGPFRFDSANGLLYREARDIPVPPRVLGLLRVLIDRRGDVVSKRELMDAVWQDVCVTEGSLLEAMSALREALGDDPHEPMYIQTVHRRGYRFLDSPRGHERHPSVADTAAIALEPSLSWWPIAAASTVPVLLALLAAAGLLGWRMPPVERDDDRLPLARFAIPLPTGATLDRDHPAVAVSPDGRHFAYVAHMNGMSRVYLRPVDSVTASPLMGTEGASGPFFSPDGRWLAFFAAGELRKVPLEGGVPLVLCEARNDFGGAWTTDGRIVFASSLADGLFTVSDTGGVPARLTSTALDQAIVRHGWPSLLPGSTGVIFTAFGLDASYLAVVSLETGYITPLIEDASFGRYSPTGHLVFARQGQLEAVAFDPATLTIAGEPRAIVGGVESSIDSGVAQFAFSATGTLLYVPGAALAPAHSFYWMGEARETVRLPLAARPYRDVAISGDGRQLASSIGERGSSDVWVSDLSRSTLLRVTDDGVSTRPTWAPDGQGVAFASGRRGVFNLFWKLVGSSSPPEPLLPSRFNQYPTSWSRDGEVIAFTELNPETGADIWLLAVERHEAQPYLRTKFDEMSARFSPDGRWLAYVSNESNAWAVYVRPHPGPGAAQRVSVDGGTWPAWAPDSRTLFYRSPEGPMAARLKTGSPLFIEPPRPLSSPDGYEWLDVAPDGRRALVREVSQERSLDRTPQVVLGWFRELGG